VNALVTESAPIAFVLLAIGANRFGHYGYVEL